MLKLDRTVRHSGEVTTLPVYRNILLAFLLLLPVYVFAAPAEQAQTPPSSLPAETAKTEQTGEKDETGSIHLGNLDLVTEEYVVQEGDWLIQILRDKGVPPKRMC